MGMLDSPRIEGITRLALGTIHIFIYNLIFGPLPPTLKSLIDQNKRACLEKSAILLAYLLIKLINRQGGIFRLLHENNFK